MSVPSIPRRSRHLQGRLDPLALSMKLLVCCAPSSFSSPRARGTRGTAHTRHLMARRKGRVEVCLWGLVDIEASTLSIQSHSSELSDISDHLEIDPMDMMRARLMLASNSSSVLSSLHFFIRILMPLLWSKCRSLNFQGRPAILHHFQAHKANQ